MKTPTFVKEYRGFDFQNINFRLMRSKHPFAR